MTDIVDRLQERLTVAPKPGTKPFVPSPGWTYCLNVGGPTPRAGDDAGYQLAPYCQEPDNRQLQAMIYAPEPLSSEAASEIMRLRSALDQARATILALKATLECNVLDAVQRGGAASHRQVGSPAAGR